MKKEMIKRISIMGIVTGMITTMIGFVIVIKCKKGFSVGIIGGADGPTSVLISGCGDFSMMLMIVGVLICVIAIAVLIIQKSMHD